MIQLTNTEENASWCSEPMPDRAKTHFRDNEPSWMYLSSDSYLAMSCWTRLLSKKGKRISFRRGSLCSSLRKVTIRSFVRYSFWPLLNTTFEKMLAYCNFWDTFFPDLFSNLLITFTSLFTRFWFFSTHLLFDLNPFFLCYNSINLSPKNCFRTLYLTRNLW